MIQRIQTIYLLLVAIISITLFNIDIPYFTVANLESNEEILVDYNSTDMGQELIGVNMGLIYFLLSTGIMAFTAIFLYRRRKLQMRLTAGCMIFVLVVLVNMYWYSYKMDYFDGNSIATLQPVAAVPISLLLLSLLAFLRIRKDEKLVRSLDRIR